MAAASSDDILSVNPARSVNMMAASFRIGLFFIFKSTHHPTNKKPHECGA